MITFGKHNGTPWLTMIETHKDYCMWILKQDPTNMKTNMLEFYNYLRNLDSKLYDVASLPTIKKITCTKLVNYIICDPTFMDLIKDLDINKHKVDKISNQVNIGPGYYGQFIDYLVRYEITKHNNSVFHDDRTKYILMNNPDDIIQTSYNDMINKTATPNDVFNVSLCHSLFFGDTLDNITQMFNTIDLDTESHTAIQKYVQSLTFKDILINPILSNHTINIIADADIIIDSTIIDIKVSNSIGTNICDFIQLIVYAILYYENNNIMCDKLVICNLLKGFEYVVHITNPLLLQLSGIVKNYKIGSNLEL